MSLLNHDPMNGPKRCFDFIMDGTTLWLLHVNDTNPVGKCVQQEKNLGYSRQKKKLIFC